MKKNNLGFTLIELLVVVLVIGALSGLMLGVINSGGVRQKSRDSQRKADLTKIATALELYFADNRSYPVSANWAMLNGSTSIETALENGYIETVPLDPSQSGSNLDPCANPGEYRYNYKTDAGGGAYVLTAIMEVSTSNDDSMCQNLSNFPTIDPICDWGATGEFCYGVENP